MNLRLNLRPRTCQEEKENLIFAFFDSTKARIFDIFEMIFRHKNSYSVVKSIFLHLIRNKVNIAALSSYLFFLAICFSGEYERGKYHCTIDLLFDWFGISCMTIENFCYLQSRLIQTSQTGGQWYSDTSPFSISWFLFLQTFLGWYLELLIVW